MNRMNRLIVFLAASTFALTALAQSPAPAAAQQDQTAPPEVTVVSGAPVHKMDNHCLRETGTRIVHKDKNACVNAAGKSYSNDDIRRTGATDIGDALQLLDPSITVHHR